MPIATNITALTTIPVMNEYTKTTRISTICNTKVDLNKYAASNTTNSVRIISTMTDAGVPTSPTFGTVSGDLLCSIYQVLEVPGESARVGVEAHTTAAKLVPTPLASTSETLPVTSTVPSTTKSQYTQFVLMPSTNDIHNTRTLTNSIGSSVGVSKSISQSPEPDTSTILPAVIIHTPASYTNVRGGTILSTSNADAIPILISNTDTQSHPLISTSFSTAPIEASLPVIISSTDAEGVSGFSTSYVPAIVLSTTNAQGSRLLTTSALFHAINLASPTAQDSQVLPNSPILPAVTAPPRLTFGTQKITANSKNQYIIGSQTLSPAAEIIVSGTPISLVPGGTQVVVGTTTQALSSQILPAVTSLKALTIGAQTFFPNAQGQYIVGSQTLTQGGTISISGTPVAFATGGGYALIGSSTENLAITPPPPLRIGTQTIAPNAQGQYVVGSQTLTPGAVITISGTPVSLAPGGAYAVIGTSTENLAAASSAPLKIGSQTITPNAQGQYIIGSQTLTPGDPAITISGTPISLASNDAYAIVGTSTENLAITSSPALTIGSRIITANPLGQYIVDGQTLTPGGVISVSGTRISLAADESDVVIGTSTEGLGGIIMGGFGEGPNVSNGTGVIGFTGVASRNGQGRELWVEGAVLGVGVGVVMWL